MRWPAKATQWMNGLDKEKMAAQLGQTPDCLAITPFQTGIGQGRGYQRVLSAPNLVQLLGERLLDKSATELPASNQHATAILFLSTGFEQLAESLEGFNALLPVPELVRAEKRASYLSRLESQKWELPSAGALPRWGGLPMARCPVFREAKQLFSGKLAALESQTEDGSPLGELGSLAQRKLAQGAARDVRLNTLKERLAKNISPTSVVVRKIGPGNTSELRRKLMAETAPGHEFSLCAGLLLVGSEEGLSFFQELVGL